MFRSSFYGAVIAFNAVAIAGAISGYQPIDRGVVVATLFGAILGTILCGGSPSLKKLQPTTAKKVKNINSHVRQRSL